MELIRIIDNLSFKNEIPETTKKEIYSIIKKLNIVKYDSSNDEIINTKINNGKWEIIYPKQMFIKINGGIFKITGFRLSTNNEIILSVYDQFNIFNYKVS